MRKSIEAAYWMTGIGDEGAPDLATQLEDHSALGWKDIELRNVDGKNVCEMSDSDFELVRAMVQDRGLSVVCFGSAIANWARPITGPFERDVEDLRRAARRMRALGTKFIRIMSYPNGGLPEEEWRKETFRRMRELVRTAEGEGVVLALENCDGWASSSPERLGEFLAEFGGPSLKVVFDTGNPVSHGGDLESTRRFFEVALPFIEHFHIKDCRSSASGAVHTFPGEGQCGVERIVDALLDSGYEGLFSIEPHMAAQVHLGQAGASGEDKNSLYLEYGRRAWSLVSRALGRRG